MCVHVLVCPDVHVPTPLSCVCAVVCTCLISQKETSRTMQKTLLVCHWMITPQKNRETLLNFIPFADKSTSSSIHRRKMKQQMKLRL